MDGLKQDAPSGGYEVTRFTCHASRPGFRIVEVTLNSTQKVPWHYHSNVQDTFYVLEGQLRISLREPKEEVCRTAGETYSVRPRRPHFVTNGGEAEVTFFVLQGVQAFEAAGADALYAPGITKSEDIRSVCLAVSKPVNVVMGLKNASLSVAELAALGVRRISLGSALSRAALGAMLRAAREIQQRGTFRFAEDAVSYAEANDLVSGG